MVPWVRTAKLNTNKQPWHVSFLSMSNLPYCTVSCEAVGGEDDDEEEAKKPKKKESKKKKKKSKEVAKKAAAPEVKEDLSTAILGGAVGRNTMHVFSYSSEDEGHSVVGMTEEALEEMGLFEGDPVSIKGKRGKKTIASVAVVSKSDVSSLVDGSKGGHPIGMSPDAMKNAGVRAGDAVTVVPAPNVKFGKNVLVLPYKDSLASAGLDEKDMEKAGIFDDYLNFYF